MSQAFLYFIAEFYILDSVRFGESEEIIVLYLQMWIFAISFISDSFSLYQSLFFSSLHRI